MSRVARARIGYLLGLAAIAAGLYLALGLGWALVATGLGVCAAFVWLYDVSEPEPTNSTGPTEGDW